MYDEVRVGVSAIILRDGHLLLGERIGSHGAHTWATPGGHLEFGESIEECAKRETLEETGLVIDTFKKLTYTNDIFVKENKHYVTLYVVASCPVGDPKVIEPAKCIQWRWFKMDELPSPLFLPLSNLFNELNNLKLISAQEA